MDIKDAFLHADFKEDIQMKVSCGVYVSSPMIVCKLKCSVYGLK